MLDFPASPTAGQIFAPAGARGIFSYENSVWRQLPGLRPVYSLVNYSGAGLVIPLPMGYSSFQIKVAGFNPMPAGTHSMNLWFSYDNAATWLSTASYVNVGMFATSQAPPAGVGNDAATSLTWVLCSGNAGAYTSAPSLPSTYDIWLDPGASTPAAVHASWLIRHELYIPGSLTRAGMMAGYSGARGRVTDLHMFAGSGGVAFTIDSLDCVGVVE
jgi:hypothetical protein